MCAADYAALRLASFQYQVRYHQDEWRQVETDSTANGPNWIGYGRIEGSRVDRVDLKANRLGQGTSGPGGMVNFYDLKSNWIGYGKPGLGGQTLELFDPRSTRMGTIKLR